MLQTMRELSKSWVFKSLMALLVVSFGIWGIGDMFRGNPAQRAVAKVGKIEIPAQMLEFRFQAELPEARNVFGPDLTAQQAKQIGVFDRTLKVMTEELSFDQESTRLGLNVNADYIMNKLAQEPQLRDKDGKFNTQMWHQILGKSGFTEQMFIDVESRNTSRQLIFSTLVSNMPVPNLVIDNLYQARGDKRILEVVTLRNDSLKNDIPTPSDADLEAYYKSHESSFVAPEYRGVTIAHLSAQAVSKDVTITDEDVKQAYESRSAELARPETRDLVQIVVQDEEKAKDIFEAAKASKSLSDAAKAKGLTPITMNKIDEKSVLPELYTSVFALEENQTAAPVKSSLGWHVVQVKKINAGGVPSFDEIKGELRTMIQEERAGDLVAKTVNQLDDALAGGRTLDDLADTLKLHLTRFATLDASGKDASGKEVKDIPAKDLTLSAAFSLASGETGQVLEDGTGNYYVVRIDQVTPSQTRPFAEVKGNVLAAWTSEQLDIKAAASAEDVAKNLRTGQSATSFASRPGMSVRLSKPISLLGDADKEIPDSAIQQVFLMKKGDVTTASAAGKHYVLKLADIVPVNPSKPESSRLKVVEDLREKIPHNYIDQYGGALRERFPVSINQDLFNNLKNRGTESN